MRCVVFLIVASLTLAFGLGPPGTTTASAAAGPELLTNTSLEQSEVAPGESGIVEPVDWSPSKWGGVGTPTFTYVKGDAHTGARSVKVEVSSYTAPGDAKWAYDAWPATGAAVTAGAYYTFSDWYKSDTTSAVSVFYMLPGEDADHGHWANLFSGIPAVDKWTQFTTGFTMPAGAVRAYFVYFVAHAGYLQTDDYSMRQSDSPPGFAHAMVSLTFDDGSAAFYSGAYQQLKSRGFKTTQYIPTAELNAEGSWMMTPGQLAELSEAGNEIGSHSVTHPDLTTLADDELKREVQEPKSLLESIIGKEVVDFAYPFGAYDARVIDALKTGGYTYARSVEEGYNSQLDLQPFDIRVQNMEITTTLDEFKSWVDYAKAHSYWLVIVYHEVVPDDAPDCAVNDQVPCNDQYATSMSRFVQQLDYLGEQGLGLNVRTVQQAMKIATNHYPTGTASLTPEHPTGKDVVTATATFTDPDPEDQLTYTYRWLRGGSVISGAEGKTLDLGKIGAVRDDVITFEATADDQREGVVKATATVNVENLAPTKGSVAISPSQPVTGTPLIATPAGFKDPDGDQLDYAYAWYRDGRLIAGRHGATLPAGEVLAGSTIRVDVRATDGHGGASDGASAMVTVAAPAPTSEPTPTPGAGPDTTPAQTPIPGAGPGSASAPTPVDTVGPRITVKSPKARTYRVGQRVTVMVSCADSSGVASWKATLRGGGGEARSVKTGAKVRLTRTGSYVLRITATDRVGNSASKTVRFRVVRR
jgi:peptidoglycan/xylan/chitin deacetylase (PgdA/CDA1 family)